MSSELVEERTVKIRWSKINNRRTYRRFIQALDNIGVNKADILQMPGRVQFNTGAKSPNHVVTLVTKTTRVADLIRRANPIMP